MSTESTPTATRANLQSSAKKLFHTNTAKEGNPPEEEEVDSSE